MVKVIAEIGINHNGIIENAEDMIRLAANAGCDYVKFQKRTPEVCVPENQRDKVRHTPWGKMTYMEYRQKVEFGREEYCQIDKTCKKFGIGWFASVWDKESADFIHKYFRPDFYKIPSAMATNHDLIKHVDSYFSNVILSTGMTCQQDVESAADLIRNSKLILFHCTSAYPCDPKDINLRVIRSYYEKFKVSVGYSGHEVGYIPTIAAVALGAQFVERHITLDKKMWGSDQRFSLEPDELGRMVDAIRATELALGDGRKILCKSELQAMEKLRS